MSPREIMNDQDVNENTFNQESERMPEIPSASAVDEFVQSEHKTVKNTTNSNNEYADSFPDWDLLPPQIEIRRISHRQT